MKRSITLVMALCISIVCAAQDSRLEIGGMAAPGVTFLYGNSFLRSATRPALSFSAGAMVQYRITKVISLHADILYEQKASISRLEYVNDEGVKVIPRNTRFNLDYLTIPVMVRATVGRKVRFIANAGPYLGVLVHQSRELKDVMAGYADMTRPVDLGISVGAGVAIPVTEHITVSVEARNNTGLLSVGRGTVTRGVEQVMSSGSVRTQSTSFFISFAYSIPARKKTEKS